MPNETEKGATESQLDTALRAAETAIGDDGFSHTVMARLPRKRRSRQSVRSWTLGGAAAAGSLVTALIGGPLEAAFSSLMLGDYRLMVFAALVFVGLLAVPVAWACYSR
jgi:hypothetical protein